MGEELARFLGRGVRESFRDDVLWVLDKPSGVLSHPNPPKRQADNALLRGTYDFGEECYRLPGGLQVWLVHRLDRETSGLIVCALSGEAAVELKRAFEDREVEKEYRALVLGVPPAASGEWRDRLDRARAPGRIEVAVARGGPPNATTAYHVVRAFPARLSLLSLTPREGRTHQIRVQCVAHGHPVAGDDRYGDFSANRWLAAEAGLRRMFLVAHSLTFRHPATGREITLRSELREEPAAVLERLESLRSTVPRRSRAKRR